MKDRENTPGERAVAIAALHVGTLREVGGPNCGPPVELFAGGRQEAWCAHMIASIFRGIRALPGDVEPSANQKNPIAWCQTMWERLREAGWVLNENAELQTGDIVFMNERGASDPDPNGWHVGLLSASSGDFLQLISGNWGDRVARHHIERDSHKIVGFARVPPRK